MSGNGSWGEMLDPKTAEFLSDIQTGYGDIRPEVEAEGLIDVSQSAGETALDGAQVTTGKIDDGYGDTPNFREAPLPFHFQIAQMYDRSNSGPEASE